MINQLEPNMVVQRNNFNPGITSFLIITIFTVKKTFLFVSFQSNTSLPMVISDKPLVQSQFQVNPKNKNFYFHRHQMTFIANFGSTVKDVILNHRKIENDFICFIKLLKAT